MIEPNDELYFYLEGLDESILLLNSSLTNFNYQFEKYKYEEFEIKFKSYFLHDAGENNIRATFSNEEDGIQYDLNPIFDYVLSNTIFIVESHVR